MAAATSSDGASTSATTSLGKRARSPPSRLTDIGNGNGNDLGNGEGPESSDDDDDDLGPMPMPAAGDGSDDAGPSAASAGMATVKRRKILRHERVYLENVPSADRYYRALNDHGHGQLAYPACFRAASPDARSLALSRVCPPGSFMHRDVVSHVAVTKCARLPLRLPSFSSVHDLASLTSALLFHPPPSEPTSSSRPRSTDTSRYGKRRIPTTRKEMLHRASG